MFDKTGGRINWYTLVLACLAVLFTYAILLTVSLASLLIDVIRISVF